MYAQFFGLKQEPFSIAPDPRYLFMSERHREALAHLLYGLRGGGGFVLLSGEIGAGKTTVCRCFLEQIPKRCNIAYIFNPKLTVTELLKTVCSEFGVPYRHDGPGAATVKDYVDPLNEFLLRTHAVGQNNVLIIDEAQNLSPDVLEQLRLLTNLETSERKLLQIILIGQPELRAMLARPELEQLAQRVTARFHLDALSEPETEQYIRHRLAVAGMGGAIPFDTKAIRRIHALSRGVPRRINLLCDRALLGAYAAGKANIGRATVEKAAREVFDRQPRRAVPRRTVLAVAGAAAFGAALVGAAIVLWGPAALPTAGQVAQNVVAPAAASAPGAASAPAGAASAGAEAPGPTAPAALKGALAAASARGEPEAWRELAAAWALDLADDVHPCEAAQRQQVHCFRSPSSTLALIRQLDRPGIVTLAGDDERPVHALLTGLSRHGATLRIDGVTHGVSLATLGRVWRGDFATFWRAPAGYQNRIVDAGSGSLADWLVTRLAELDGEPVPAVLADATLRPRVTAFQLANGLKPDGLAGPTTLMQLNRATGVAEPRLDVQR